MASSLHLTRIVRIPILPQKLSQSPDSIQYRRSQITTFGVCRRCGIRSSRRNSKSCPQPCSIPFVSKSKLHIPSSIFDHQQRERRHCSVHHHLGFLPQASHSRRQRLAKRSQQSERQPPSNVRQQKQQRSQMAFLLPHHAIQQQASTPLAIPNRPFPN
jgi:hypothetical protein